MHKIKNTLSGNVINGRNNIVSKSQKEIPNLDQGSELSDDDDRRQPRFVSKSDVRFNCLQRTHQLIVINHALQGANYNTPITREVIYTIGQSDFT